MSKNRETSKNFINGEKSRVTLLPDFLSFPESDYYRIVIIGAGPAGMTAAIAAYDTFMDMKADPNSFRIVVLEANSEAGRKLKATGNGKCNFTNLKQGTEFYHSDDTEKLEKILKEYDEKSCIEFYNSLDIPFRERNGYCYPYNEEAATVKELFEKKTESIGMILKNRRVKHIQQTDRNSLFRLITADKEELYADKVICACGGLSYQVFGSNGDGFYMAKELGLDVVKTLPALCGLKSSDSILLKLDGVRTQAEIKIYVSEKEERNCVYAEEGEIIFTNGSVSGIPVMNASRHAVKALEEGKKVRLTADFVPLMSPEKLQLHLKDNFKSIDEFADANGFVKKKIAEVFVEEIKRQKSIKPGLDMYEALADMIKGFSIEVTGQTGYEKAQVTQGGVSLKSLNDNLEADNIEGLFFAGENINVDGNCGGYNLQWAYSSGFTAGRAAAKEFE